MSQPSELKVTWWCTQCNTTGDLIFRNHDSVASRLEAAERNHKLHAPHCNLDWARVVVQTDVEEG